MIVVIGNPSYRPPEPGAPDSANGLAARVAKAAVAAGGGVQLVGKIGDDGAGDAVVLALAREGIGHAAILRDPGRPTPIIASRGDRDGLEEASRNGMGSAAVAVGVLGTELLGEEAGADRDIEFEREELLPADPAERPVLEPADVELALRYLTEFGVVVVADPLSEAAAGVAAEAATYAGAHLVSVVAPGAAAPAGLESATVLEAPRVDPDGVFASLVGAYAAGLDAGLSPAEAFRQATDRVGWQAAASP